MSDQTNLLRLPYIQPSQAQKHVTHNEALRLLDATVQLSVADRHLTTPPTDPVEGERHIVAAGGSDGWLGKDGQVAAFQDGAWLFLQPQTGWLAWVADEQRLRCRTGGVWAGIEDAIPSLQNLSLLGVGTTADAVNPFSAKLNKALWSARYGAEGGDGDLRYTFNKEGPASTVSLLMQSNWSGRAEIGLTGDDDLHVKVSADGSAWKEAIRVEAMTGAVRLPSGLAHAPSGAPMNGLLFTAGGDGAVSIWRLNASHVQNPRGATVSSVSGDTITLTAAIANQFFENIMAGVSYVRIWNTSKSPNESAWIKAKPSSSTLQVLDAASVAGWAAGDAIQIGDPTDLTPGRVIALDISPMLQNLFGVVFRQSGIMVKAFSSGAAGSDGLALSPTGIGGSFVSCATAGASDGVTVIPCTQLSPVSNSNLVFLQETAGTTTTTEIVSSLGVFA
jgi:hypothetical protein